MLVHDSYSMGFIETISLFITCDVNLPCHAIQVLLLHAAFFCHSKEVANFHRPKALWYPCDNEKAVKSLGKLPTQGPMKIIIKSLGGKGSKLYVDHEETVFSVKAKSSKKLGCHLFFDVFIPFTLNYCLQSMNTSKVYIISGICRF